MPSKVVPTSGEKSKFILHMVIFAIANAAMWIYWYYGQGAKDTWVYPWAIWITAAWGLSLLGHWAGVHRNYEDAGVKEYQRQMKN
ncbi:MAG: 2TM domain-containing protein [Chitinophagaceae bacterium]|nr:2TM domain-containing protein [Chitinophagaceae bacterium]